MKTRIAGWFMWVLCWLLLVAGFEVRGEETLVALPVPGQVVAKLQALFKQYYPKASFTKISENSIRFEYQAGTFEFPYSGPPGRKHQATTQRGPKAGGILCDVFGQKGSYQGQLFMAARGDGRYLPFTMDRQYYRELFMVAYSSKQDMHISAAVSYPPDADAQFLKQFRAIIDGYAKESE